MNTTDILQEIVANKKLEVAQQKQAVSKNDLLALGKDRLDRPIRSMRQALASSPSGVIAEFKRRSPSKGWLHPNALAEDIVPAYEKNGAAASSILTDSKFFGGSLGDLKIANRLVNSLPLLRKDFIIDEYQLYQSRVMGADAVLLIAACLEIDQCRELSELAHLLGLEVLLEVHSEKELDYVSDNVDILGVNNRHLGTFHTDVQNTFSISERMNASISTLDNPPLLISESGISEPQTVVRLRQIGFRGFLIGETFMKTDNPGAALAQFIGGIVC